MQRLSARAVIGSQEGLALVLTLLILTLLSVLAVGLSALGMTEGAASGSWKDYSSAFFAADAGLESGVVNLRTILQGRPNPTTADLNGIAAPSLITPGLSFAAFSVTKAAPAHQTTFAGGPYAGFTGIVTDYRIAASATGPGGSSAALTQVFQLTQLPLFQFGVFYGRGVDLEIAPGPLMTFNGRVHANSSIYLGAGSTLKFNSTITTAGTINRYLKRDPSSIPWGNNPQIMDNNAVYQNLNFDHTYKPNFGSQWASATDWKNQATSTFGSQVRDSAMGVAELTPLIPDLFYNPSNPDVVSHELIEMPTGSDSADLKAAKLYSQAGLRIVDGAATDGQGNSVSLPGGIVTTTSFYDAREAQTMTVTEVDVGQLRSTGLAPANGILYVATTSGTGKAVRLVNGSRLPSQGLTVVSQNPVYIRGDYNTVNKVAAAVLGDAITVLSNNWAANNSDGKGNQSTSARPASATTVNAAFATGPSAESQPNQGNGQLENVIRFLEDWNGRNFTYSGSIVSLWHSLQATGAWNAPGTGAGQYYTAPARIWSYDTLFNTTVPPGTPSAIIMAKGRWSRS